MSLSVKNMLGGGGGSNAPYSWKRYRVETIEIENPEYSYVYDKTTTGYTARGSKFVVNIPEEYSSIIDISFFNGFAFVNGTSTLFTINDGKAIYSNATYEIEYYSPNKTLAVFGITSNYSTSAKFRFDGTKTVKKYHFIEYVSDKNANAYPNGDVASDGFYYEHSNSGKNSMVKSSYTNDISQDSLASSSSGYNMTQGNAIEYKGAIHLIGTNDATYQTYHYSFDGINTKTASTLPFSPRLCRAIVWNDELHIIGGANSSTSYRQHWKWDGETWTQLGDLPYDYGFGGIAVYNDEIHILGSYTSNYSTRHRKWDGESWTVASTIPTNALNTTACTLEDGVHIFGSASNSAYYQMHWKWDGETWTQLTDIPNQSGRSSGCRCIEFCGKAFVYCQTYSNNTYMNIWDNGEWEAEQLGVANQNGAMATLNETLYLFATSYRTPLYKLIKVYANVGAVAFTDCDELDNSEYDFHEYYAKGYLYTASNIMASTDRKIYHGLGAKPKYVVFKAVGALGDGYNQIIYAEYNVEQIGGDISYLKASGSIVSTGYTSSGSPSNAYSRITVDENYFYLDKCYAPSYDGACVYRGGYSWFAIL